MYKSNRTPCYPVMVYCIVVYIMLIQMFPQIDLDDIDKSSIEGDERLSQLYYQSKLANVCFTDSLDRLSISKYEGKFTANSLNPGVVNTAISRYSNVPFYSPVPLISKLQKFTIWT